MTNNADTPKPPTGTSEAGRRLWCAVVAEYELDEHELALLREAVRTVTLLGELDAAVRRDGALLDTAKGPRAHPAVVEARQQRITLARLLAALRMPADVQHGDGRPQRRTGVRGPYRLAS